MNTLSVESITKSYDDFKAVDGVSFQVGDGQMFGLLGPNGAGKTTTMRMIMNIIVPDAGNILLFGEPFRESYKNRIGYLPEERGLYPKMKLKEHLQFLGEMKGMKSAEAADKALRWLERFELLQWAGHKVQDLSKGMQQKVQFIGTIIHSPQLLIVDEPFSGLDPVNTKFLKDILMELKQQGKTIILSTHLMDQAEKLCDHICLIDHGKVILYGDLQDIKTQYSHNAVLLEYSGEGNLIKDLAEIDTLNDYGNYMEVRLKDGVSQQKFFRKLAQTDVEIRKFEAAETSLNEIFIEMVGGNKNE